MKTNLKENSFKSISRYLRCAVLLLFCLTAYNLSAQDAKEKVVYDMVDQMPQFPGGQAAMMKYIAENTKWTEQMDCQGRVIVQFVVNADGKISDAKVKRGVCPSIDQEAIRVVESMPTWEPGKLKGEAVNVRYTVPVMFRMK